MKNQKLRVAINGFGRIGKEVFRAVCLEKYRDAIEVVAINVGHTLDMDRERVSLVYDSIHGKFPHEVTVNGDFFSLVGQRVQLFGTRDPSQIDWRSLGVDIVLECTGKFRSRKSVQVHLDAGAKKVLISAPGDDVDATIVFGVNDDILTGEERVVSAASCTTNCLAPLVKILEDSIGILAGEMTTIHSYTGDQNLIDGTHTDPRRARAAAVNIVPTKTGAAQAIGLVIPSLAGKLKGSALRVPTPNVSLVQLAFLPTRTTSIKEVNTLIRTASEKYPDILGYSIDPLVSSDFCGDSRSSIFDPTLTSIVGTGSHQIVTVSAWYDNETAYSHRMVDVALRMG